MRESCTSGSERGKPRKGLTYLPNPPVSVFFTADIQYPARLAQRDPVDSIIQQGDRDGHQGADPQSGQLAGAKALIIEIQDHGKKAIDGAGAHHCRCEKDAFCLIPYRMIQIGIGGAQTPQVFIDQPSGQHDGHSPGKGDDKHGCETYNGYKNEKHEIDSQCLQKILFVQNPELGHIFPVQPERGTVPLVIINFFESMILYMLRVEKIKAFFVIVNLFYDRIPALEELYVLIGMVCNVIKQCFGKIIAVFPVRYVKQAQHFLPFLTQACFHGQKIFVVHHIVSEKGVML